MADPQPDPFGQAVSPETFASHLAILSASYRLQKLTRLLEEMDHGSLVHGTVAVTFDDGYADTLLTAAPRAARAGVPFDVFVTVRPVLDGSRFWWDELAAGVLTCGGPSTLEVPEGRIHLRDAHERRSAYTQLHGRLKQLPEAKRAKLLAALLEQMPRRHEVDVGRPLTPHELRRLASQPDVGIGAHTVSHPSLGALEPADQRHELEHGRRMLTDLVGQPVELLSYPFGKEPDVGPETPRLAEEAGFAAAFTTIARPLVRSSRRFALPRFTVHEWPEPLFCAKLDRFFGR